MHMRKAFTLLFIVACVSLSMFSGPYTVWAANALRPQGLPLTQEQREAQMGRVRTHMSDPAFATQGTLQVQDHNDWRIRIREAAVTKGDTVLLGEVADALGSVPPDIWQQLRTQPLWPAPPEPGKPLQINKMRLGQALHEVLGDMATRCILPSSLVIQRDGVVLREDDLRNYLVRFLTPQLNAMPGTAELTDFRLPSYIFLAHSQQQVNLEHGKIVPGRISFRFVVQEMDGTELRRVAGAAFLNLWVETPAAARPFNKGDPLDVNSVTFIRVNAAHLKGIPWDGRGGPWQFVRSVGTGQTIFQSDLLGLAMMRKGSIVRLVYKRGSVRIEVHGESLADGEPGAIIPVRNLQSKKQVYATVIDSKTVMIQ